ncbi:SLAC1 family transporter [Aeromicrobium fastidiosum]|uniref:C4-dicarboxylate ABC transporter n=1 Tax=Aeromicrobium fastidiosum TaxID=52699 RepID=A0A641AL70_9ACTN|nr:C4-dicarboxylate ABC transporter [Aeromicrobium fastidiosum]KAA1376436.1 C4-dicarboxylate ABC transporter [Aeromicrobium fastidiosum]MBP2391649.1 tellurite resistance protein TehA-like permease [Aeromicrobium fastidiosum]
MTTTVSLGLRRGSSDDALSAVGPHWFTWVMGTGIVATAAAGLPVHARGLHALSIVMWALASLLLLAVGAATAAQWGLRPSTARGHVEHPVIAHFYGAPAMALMTVGAATLLVGVDLVGLGAAVAVDVVLWSAGTALGLWTLISIPRRTLRGADPYGGPAFGGWLMPVVPPMVSAATGALLVPHLAASLRPAMKVGCCAFFAVALVASAPLLLTIVRRTLDGHIGEPTSIPTLVIVLGPLGQSATAAHVLGGLAGGTAQAVALGYGCAAVGVALTWALVAAVIVARAIRDGLPFALTWWSFTFPVGTVVTGTSGLAVATGSDVLSALAAGLFVALVGAWTVVAALTVRGLVGGVLLAPPTRRG